eukprot:gene15755-17344_t
MEDDEVLEFSIQLEGCMEGEESRYYGGSQVIGQVGVDLKKPMEMRNLGLQLEGEAYCHWSETQGSGDRKRRIHHTGKEVVVRLVKFVFGNPPGGLGEPVTLHPSGRHFYPFTFELPCNLPSSVEGRLGHVKYTLKATISRPVKQNYDTEKTVLIRETIDPNSEEFLTKQPPGGRVTKQVGSCCFPTGVLSLNASLDRSAFCLGESIRINAVASNCSSTNMRSFKAKLVQTMEFHAQNIVKSDTRIISTARGPAIPHDQEVSFGNQPLNVPETTPSITNSGVIKLHYDVLVEVDVPCGLDLDVKMPVIIGTVPFGQPFVSPVLQSDTQQM